MIDQPRMEFERVFYCLRLLHFNTSAKKIYGTAKPHLLETAHLRHVHFRHSAVTTIVGRHDNSAMRFSM